MHFTKCPEVELTCDVMVFDTKQDAAGGYPPIHNISLVNNGQVILNRVLDKVRYTTRGGVPHNTYRLCDSIVNNLAGMSKQAIFLQHKGYIYTERLFLLSTNYA